MSTNAFKMKSRKRVPGLIITLNVVTLIAGSMCRVDSMNPYIHQV